MNDFDAREETLDPENWEELNDLGKRMVSDMLTYLKNVRERKVWQAISLEIKEYFNQPLPTEEQNANEVYEEFLKYILPHPLGNIHPRFWGWVMGSGTPVGMLGEMLAAGMNPNLWGTDHIANYVEAQVIDWCRQMMGFPANSSGLLVSGASMANLTGLAVARNTKAGFDIRRHGLVGSPRMTIYGSTEMHSSIQKAVEVLGLGSDSLRKIPVNQNYQIEIASLEAAISDDRKAGYQPICVIGNAGTVNTGAFDDLISLAELARREVLWFHVDGAFGALAKMSAKLSPLLSGMERADSLAFDLHKWLSVPIEAACILVRDAEAHRNSFSLTPTYLVQGNHGLAAGALWPHQYGIELTRRFSALKIWISLKNHGIRKYARMIEQNVQQAQYFSSMIKDAPQLELLAPVSLNIVCFRFNAEALSEAALNELNRELLSRLQEGGVAIVSNTLLNGKFGLRMANVNQRSRREDFEILMKEVIRLGTALSRIKLTSESAVR